jgi:hypothetical protein
MKFNWKKTVAAIAPVIGTAIGGPFGGMAAKVVTDALGLPEGSPDADIEKAIQANPEAMVKLKEAEFAFKAKLKELEIEESELVYKDIDSARSREAKTGDSWTPRILSAFVCIGFLGVLSYLLAYGKPEMGGDALLILLGALGASFTQVINYYFGSSHGSDKKNDMIYGRRSSD